MTTSIVPPTKAAAAVNPIRSISAIQIGTNNIPAMLTPFCAWASAAGRRRSNQGATMKLTAVGPPVAQPAPVKIAAPNNCHGIDAVAQQTTPNADAATPALVIVAVP